MTKDELAQALEVANAYNNAHERAEAKVNAIAAYLLEEWDVDTLIAKVKEANLVAAERLGVELTPDGDVDVAELRQQVNDLEAIVFGDESQPDHIDEITEITTKAYDETEGAPLSTAEEPAAAEPESQPEPAAEPAPAPVEEAAPEKKPRARRKG